jgi:photosystem II stability/assembly factor-like uncharacterized protein
VAAVAAALTAFAATPSAEAKGAPVPKLSWQLVDTGSTARLRGLSPVSGEVAWASGTLGTVLRTVDGGRTVESVGPAGTGALQFRSLYASSADHAVAVSIGDTPDAFRAYVTDDGGRTWTTSLQNADPSAFYDCLTFTDKQTGYILGDPVDGKFQVFRTTDGGHSWELMPSEGMPAARSGEFAFAASGTCIQSNDRGDLFIASGGVDPARVFRSTDGGATWTVQDSPVAGSGSGGIFSLSFGHGRGGVAVGGDFNAPTAAVSNAAYTTDGGRTWSAGSGLGGYRSGSSWLGRGHGGVLAVGPTGSDVSRDGGRSWTAFDTGSFDAVECTPTGCWASGEQGRLARLVSDR